jgi:asparagine synthase (glutamine-hydrolysing)
MSAITGVWHLDGRSVGEDLTHLNRPLTHHRYETDVRWVRGPVGLGCRGFGASERQPDPPPATEAGAGVVTVFDGRLDNREELLDTLGPVHGLSLDAPDAAFILAAYARFGRALPEQLLGDFAFALFDPERQELLLARDAMGLRPLYFWRSSAIFLFASTIKSLLAHPAVPSRPNDAVVARFVTGHVSEDDRSSTFFDGVSTLPAAHVAFVTPRQCVTRQYWDFDLGRRVRLRGMGEYAEAFGHHFNRAVARRLRSPRPVAVSLSGGLDSSAVYGAAETIRRGDVGRHSPVIGLSYVHTDHSLADETAYLRDIEQKFGTGVERLPAGRASFVYERELEEVWRGEAPFVELQVSDLIALLDRAHGLGARVVLTGHYGDELLLDESYLIDLFRRFRWLRVWSDLRELPRWFTDAEQGVFARNFLTDLIKCHLPSQVLVGLARWVRRRGESPPGVASWYTSGFLAAGEIGSQRRAGKRPGLTAYQTSMHRALRSTSLALDNDWDAKTTEARGLERRVPFLDRDLAAFLLSIPGEVQTWNGVPKGLLRHAMRPVLPASIAGRRWKADYSHLGNETVNQSVPWLLNILRSGSLAVECGYVDRQRALDELARRDPSHGELFQGREVSRLVGLELWLRVFFGGGKTRHNGTQLERGT